MMVINVTRWFLAAVLALVLLPIAWVFTVATILVSLILALFEEIGLNIGVVGEAFIELIDKWVKLYSKIILKVAPANARLWAPSAKCLEIQALLLLHKKNHQIFLKILRLSFLDSCSCEERCTSRRCHSSYYPLNNSIKVHIYSFSNPLIIYLVFL